MILSNKRGENMLNTLSVLTDYLPIVLYVLIFGIISYFVSIPIAKRNKKKLFILPGVLLAITAILAIFAFATNDWGALGYFILGALAFGGFIASLIASLILYFKGTENSQKKD